MLLLKGSPAAEEGDRADVKARFRRPLEHRRDTGCYRGGGRVSWHLACAAVRPECGRWKLRLSKISDLLPANLKLDFLVEGEEEEMGEKGRCQERLLTWQPDKRLPEERGAEWCSSQVRPSGLSARVSAARAQPGVASSVDMRK